MKDKVLFFAQATLYRKRATNLETDIPDEIFEELKTYIKDPSWKEIYSKKGMKVFKNSYPGKLGRTWLEVANVYSNVNQLFDILWDVKRRKEWEIIVEEIRIIEVLSPRSEVFYVRTNALGIITDFCFFQSKKYYEDGSIGIISCSVDHKDIPLTNIIKMDLVANYLEPCSENLCKFYGLNQMSLEGTSRLNRIITSSDFLLSRVSQRVKNVRNILEKNEKKKSKEMKKELSEIKKEIKKEMEDIKKESKKDSKR